VTYYLSCPLLVTSASVAVTTIRAVSPKLRATAAGPRWFVKGWLAHVRVDMNKPSPTLIPSVGPSERAIDATHDERVARQQVEEVFGLTGGELSDAAWRVFDEAGAEREYAYSYDGPPVWAAHDFADRHDAEYRTVIGCCLFGEPPATIDNEAGTWTRVAAYVSSGEAVCPLSQADDCEARGERPCELCAASDDEKHGHLYLGDGWCEVVYRRACEEEEGAESEAPE